MVLLSVLVSALAFSPGPASFRTERCSAPVMSMDRRSALLGAAAAAAAAVPLAANAEVFQGGTSLGFDDGKDYNKGTEEAMAAIAAKNRAKEEAKKAAFLASRREKTGDEILEEQEAKKQLIINGRRPQLLRIVTLLSLRDLFVPSYVAVAAGGSLLSVPFFLPNLQRLFIKVTSAGADDGYSSIGPVCRTPRTCHSDVHDVPGHAILRCMLASKELTADCGLLVCRLPRRPRLPRRARLPRRQRASWPSRKTPAASCSKPSLAAQQRSTERRPRHTRKQNTGPASGRIAAARRSPAPWC